VSPWGLYAFDLDGTLLVRDGTLPPEVERFVRGLAGRARVTLATGRSLASARPYAERLRVNTPAILYHGAVIWDLSDDRALKERRIPPKAARHALAVCKNFSCDVQLYRGVGDPIVYVERLSPPVLEFARKESLPVRKANLPKLAREGPLKLLIVGEPQVLPRLAEALRHALPALTVVRAEESYLEVLPPEVDKGTALKWLCGRLGVPLSQAVAVGDQESDISMIQVAGLGVAMAHAPPGVRAVADRVVRTVLELAKEGDR